MTDWVCVISDDCSLPDTYRQIEAEIDGDARFVISRSETRLGFYRNFERALGMVPGSAELVALCDQDDRWYPEKLAELENSLGRKQLAYSDQRLVTESGEVIAETYWSGRRNNHTNYASMLIANTVTGAASLFRREMLDFALPFPEAPGEMFHDHWLALVAMSTGGIAYVDRPLYDYVQHGSAVLGHADANAGIKGRPAKATETPQHRRSPPVLLGLAFGLLQRLPATVGSGSGPAWPVRLQADRSPASHPETLRGGGAAAFRLPLAADPAGA